MCMRERKKERKKERERERERGRKNKVAESSAEKTAKTDEHAMRKKAKSDIAVIRNNNYRNNL